jgi:hypothetical protein
LPGLKETDTARTARRKAPITIVIGSAHRPVLRRFQIIDSLANIGGLFRFR